VRGLDVLLEKQRIETLMKSKTRILLLTGLLLTAVGTWLLVTQGKTPDMDATNGARIDKAIGSRPKAGIGARHREASGAVPSTKRLKERLWTADDLERYLVAHERSRESLIAAFLSSGDPELIREAAQRFPDDPMVVMLALAYDASPDQRREWAERLKIMQPENALAAYLLAWVDLEEGDSVAALDEIRRGVNLNSFDAFSKEGVLSLEALHLEFGFSPEVAKFRAAMELKVPYFERIQAITKQLESMSQGAESRDQATELAILGAAIGSQFSEGPGRQMLVHQLLGLGIEKRLLRLLDPDMESPYLSDSPRTLIQQIEAERQRIVEAPPVNYHSLLAEGLLSDYIDRMMVEGEASANIWAAERLDSR
jgi:hypothetical protein